MKDLSKRLPTTAVLIVFAYCAIRFLPAIYFSAVLYLLISLAAFELIRLTRPQAIFLAVDFFQRPADRLGLHREADQTWSRR